MGEYLEYLWYNRTCLAVSVAWARAPLGGRRIQSAFLQSGWRNANSKAKRNLACFGLSFQDLRLRRAQLNSPAMPLQASLLKKAEAANPPEMGRGLPFGQQFQLNGICPGALFGKTLSISKNYKIKRCEPPLWTPSCEHPWELGAKRFQEAMLSHRPCWAP